jgi:hypothetical protein
MKNYFITVLVLFWFPLSFCAYDKPENPQEDKKNTVENPQSMEDLSKALEQMGQAMSGGENVEPVDFRELKKCLPESFGDFEKIDSRGEKNAAFGIKVSEAAATYKNKSGGEIEISIKDVGTMKGFVAMGLAAWTMAEFEKETDDSYERTTTFDKYKAMEEYNFTDKSGYWHHIINARIIVDIEGTQVEEKDLKSARESVKNKELENLVK